MAKTSTEQPFDEQLKNIAPKEYDAMQAELKKQNREFAPDSILSSRQKKQ